MTLVLWPWNNIDSVTFEWPWPLTFKWPWPHNLEMTLTLWPWDNLNPWPRIDLDLVTLEWPWPCDIEPTLTQWPLNDLDPWPSNDLDLQMTLTSQPWNDLNHVTSIIICILWTCRMGLQNIKNSIFSWFQAFPSRAIPFEILSVCRKGKFRRPVPTYLIFSLSRPPRLFFLRDPSPT